MPNAHRSGVYMSELLYMFTQIDERVAPLVSTVRRWAQASGVTNANPGGWISNFSLTCLVIFYLQQLSEPVLPSINTLIAQARPHDKRTPDEDDLQCTFLRDLNALEFARRNTDPLDHLLIGFFEFYSQLDFHKLAISLNDAKLHPKPDYAEMHVVNPLQQCLNVTKNVNGEGCMRFCNETRNAAWLLEASEKSPNKRDASDAWGLMNLFRPKGKASVRPAMFVKPRMVEVTNLFNDTETTTPATKTADGNVKFKNDSVKNEVANIRKKSRLDVNAMKASENKR